MHTKRVSHVCDFVFSESSLLSLRHGALVLSVVFGGGCETGFCQAAFEDFHDAVCVRVAGLMLVLDLATLGCAFESVRCIHDGLSKGRLTGVSPADTSIKVDRRTGSLHHAGD